MTDMISREELREYFKAKMDTVEAKVDAMSVRREELVRANELAHGELRTDVDALFKVIFVGNGKPSVMATLAAQDVVLGQIAQGQARLGLLGGTMLVGVVALLLERLIP